MNKADIIEAIEKKIGTTKPLWWTIGLTNDPDTKKQQHQNAGKTIKYWIHWKADTETTGKEVEQHFLALGMKGVTGAYEQGGYVYVF